MIERLVIASKNEDKIAEIEAVLVGLGAVHDVVWGLAWEDVEETGDSLAANALLKAHAVVTATGFASLGDDTGLEVDALGGSPGLFTARYAGPGATYRDNVEKLLDVMAGVEDRSAEFRTVMALVTPAGQEWVAEGKLRGRITLAPRGTGGFGYDPVFEVGGRTLAEIGPHEKNEMSHRALALKALAGLLADG